MKISDGIVLRICRGPNCSEHSDVLERAARTFIEQEGLHHEVGIAHEACFGRCGMAPNVLVERWRDGKRNEQALTALMTDGKHPDMRFESGTRPEEIPSLITWHHRAWQSDREKKESQGS